MPDSQNANAPGAPQASRQPVGSRSPNYPQLSVGPAIERAKKLYEKEHTHSVPAQVAAEALGYKSLSGTAKGVLSTLRKYGLVTSDGKDGYRASNDTVAISELPDNDPERNAAIRRLALRPVAFKQLAEKYGNTLPSEGALRHYLIQNGYQSDGANLLIRVYKETLEFLARIPENSPDETTQPTDTELTQNVATSKAIPTTATIQSSSGPQLNASTTDRLQVRLSGKCTAEIIFSGEVTPEAIENLKTFLDWARNVYVSPSSQPVSVDRNKTPIEQHTSLFDETEEDDEDFGDLEEDEEND